MAELFPMNSPVKLLTVVQYYKDHKPWVAHPVKNPLWSAVDEAIRRMDNFCFPIILLSCAQYEDAEGAFEDEDAFNVIGGAGRFALFQMTGPWRYDDSSGRMGEVRLWDSDQGYFCQEGNILVDIEKVLRIAKRFYETGSYDGLSDVQ